MITAIFGVLPIALGANVDFLTREITVGAPATQWWISLSTAIMFGLGLATVLTLIVTPAALMAVHQMRAIGKSTLTPILLETGTGPRPTYSDYIERFYNLKRRHSTLGYISPVEFELNAQLA